MTETVRYGLHVSLLALPCSPVMRTERALQVVGPAGGQSCKSLLARARR